MNTNWKPKAWIAILLGIFLQAFTFLYVHRPRLFWFYFILTIAASLFDWKFQTFITPCLSIICPIHAYFIVKKFESSNERGWYSRWWGIPAIIATFFVTVFLFRSFLYEPFVYPSGSMQPTISKGKPIIVKKLGYGTYGTFGVNFINGKISSPNLMKRGKLYVFYPPGMDIAYAKRLIAISGDTIAIEGDNVILNGSALVTDKLHESEDVTVYEQQLDGVTHSIQRIKKLQPKDWKEIVVPENSYFFMGDNRDNSSDSRFWGSVTSDRIIGEIVYVGQ